MFSAGHSERGFSSVIQPPAASGCCGWFWGECCSQTPAISGESAKAESCSSDSSPAPGDWTGKTQAGMSFCLIFRSINKCFQVSLESKTSSLYYLQCVAGVILRGLIFEGLAQEKCAFVVDFIPVFAVAHLQGWFDVLRTFLVPEVELQKQRNHCVYALMWQEKHTQNLQSQQDRKTLHKNEWKISANNTMDWH